ncbi:uncharacterized protein LOC104421768 [Eucalyptus grandis]|uniref:uncharacterized protein LOC104421768 n=1 Tax=Eucalyptus grandis TaxID=71139 RepID=UPI00192EB321|nr:uncharacterized protein LOC104421768 [Eucalyptus grandis]
MATPANGNDAKVEEVAKAEERKYFQKVLDDIVGLNSWFTVAMFVGLSLANPGQVHSLEEDRPECDPDARLRKRLIFYEIASFSFFIFSGFLGKTVKIVLYIYEKKRYADPPRQTFSLVAFYLAIYGTMTGCLFLLLAMVDVVQIKLGKVSCGSDYAVRTVAVLVGAVGVALTIYFFTVSYGMLFTERPIRKASPPPDP